MDSVCHTEFKLEESEYASRYPGTGYGDGRQLVLLLVGIPTRLETQISTLCHVTVLDSVIMSDRQIRMVLGYPGTRVPGYP
eukprot:2437348-Rhodomonas_salina.1